MTPLPVENLPSTLDQALEEIERLRSRLAIAERARDSHWRTIHKILPPIPPDYDFQEADLPRLLADAVPAERILAEIASAESSR